VTFWALGEMVKAQAGILETDPAGTARAKLSAMAADLLPDPAEARWVEGHLRPLVGLAGDAELGLDRQPEAFAPSPARPRPSWPPPPDRPALSRRPRTPG
jgi:hypothetical protein